jgi:hypothetical protein
MSHQPMANAEPNGTHDTLREPEWLVCGKKIFRHKAPNEACGACPEATERLLHGNTRDLLGSWPKN